MAIIRYFGKPTIFITYTANPTCPKIQRELRPGEKPLNRPDLVYYIYNMVNAWVSVRAFRGVIWDVGAVQTRGDAEKQQVQG